MALLPAFQSAVEGPDGKLNIVFNVQMAYPMRWLQVDFTVDA
jgi:hypothetical protein